MFITFYYKLRDIGIPISPTSFLTLQRALSSGMINSLNDFYVVSRTVLIKNEKYFDLYDQMFAHYFEGAELPDTEGVELDEIAKAMLDDWLKNPKELANALGLDENELSKLSPDELIDYFKERLKDQTERHDGGSKWIGTGGRSPVGHSGYHPGGMRVGGGSRNKSAVKVAGERRYKEYSTDGPLTSSMMAEALKRLRNLIPAGPKDVINIDESIYQTMKNAGEIEIVFERGMKDRLKLILVIDNGGWSMDPYISVVQTIFDYARTQFKDITTYFFHNTIYGEIWKDPQRYKSPINVNDLIKQDPDTRLIILGDASMAPYELMSTNGSIYIQDRSGKPSIEQLKFLTEIFPHCVWLNPVQMEMWNYTRTIQMIASIFPMFELSLDGLEKAIEQLML